MLFFLKSFATLQLDIVGFLAILGEASVLANAQVAALSKFSLLPRLLPAPQALIRTKRLKRLEPSEGKVVGSHNGNYRGQINHVAHVLHQGEKVPDYSIRCVRVTRNVNQPPVKASSTGPLAILSILGCAMSIALLVLSVTMNDGMALLATVLLSTLSSIVGIASLWTLKLPRRTTIGRVPKSDVVIIFPGGQFLIVRCDEMTARELYWAPERCEYLLSTTVYRFISLLATLMLMFGVIALANASLHMQIAFAAAYILLNAAYWVVAALPSRLHWDLKSFIVERETYEDEDGKTYTEALWKAIAVTRSIDWVKVADAAPQTEAWSQWLVEARTAAMAEKSERDPVTGVWSMPKWDPQRALTEAMFENLTMLERSV